MLGGSNSGDARAGGTARCLVHVAHLESLKTITSDYSTIANGKGLSLYRFEEDRRRFILGAVLARCTAAAALQANAATLPRSGARRLAG